MKIPQLLCHHIKRNFNRILLPAYILSAFSPTLAIENTLPQLAVSEATSGSLLEGAAISFGTIARGYASVPKIFQLGNSGSAPLTVTQIRFQGGNASDYKLGTVTLPLVINQGETVSVQITCRPASTGARTTVMQVASDHAGTPGAVFSLNLSANAVSPIVVGFAVTEVNLTQASTSAVLRLTRRTSTLAQTVRLTTLNGVAVSVPYYAGAEAGVDYAAVNQTVSFAVGDLSRTVTVPLQAKTSLDTPNRRFTAVLSEPTGGATLGVSSVTVNLKATDAAKPVLALTYPDALTTTIDAAVTPVVTVQGTVSDAKGIARVTLSLNSSTAATIPFTSNDVLAGPDTLPGDSRDISFSKQIIARLGSNTLVVRAYDMRGNSSVITRTFSYTGGVPVTVERVVPSLHTTKPSNAGSMRMKADPVSHVTPLAATPNVRVEQSLAVPGAILTLTATAGANHAFSHFENLPAGAQVVGATANFAMPTSATAVRAHFVAQTYTAPTGYGDAFQGLVRFDESATENAGKIASAATSGMVTTNMTSRGVLSGTILIDQSQQSFTGQAFADGRVTLGASATTQGQSITVGQHNITMTYDAADRKTLIVNAVHAPTSTHSKGYLRRAYYSAARKVPAEFRGYYTLRIEGELWHHTENTATRPGGLGFASFTVSETGLATVTAELPDGSQFTCKTVLVDEISTHLGEVFVHGRAAMPIYAQVRPAGVSSSAPKGAYLSQWSFYRFGSDPFVNVDFTDDVISFSESPGALNWFRPAYAGSIAYVAGWPNGLALRVKGNRYNRTLSAQQVFAAPAPDSQFGNAYLQLGGGKLSTVNLGTVYKEFNFVSNTITQFGSSDSAFQVTVSPSTGLVTGSFRPNWLNPASKYPTFRGMVLQSLPTQWWKPNAYGRFQSNIVGDSAPEIGWFSMTPRQ